MGFKTILLILAFLIIFGSIIMFLGGKQIDAKADLSEKYLLKQTQQHANDHVSAAIRELKESINNSNGVPTPYKASNNGRTIITDDTTTNITIHENTYTDNMGVSHPLTTNQYYIVCSIETTGPDGTIYRQGTNALYQAGGNYTPPPYTPPVIRDPFITDHPEYLRMTLGVDDFFIFQTFSGQDNQNIFQHYNKAAQIASQIETIGDNPRFSNILYFPGEFVRPGNNGPDPLPNYGPAVVISCHSTNTDGSSPVTIANDITIIVEGNIRIDGPILTEPGVKVNLIALPYPIGSSTGGKIYTTLGNNNTGKIPNPSYIKADLYSRPVANSNPPIPGTNIDVGRSPFRHEAPYTKNALSDFDVNEIIDTIVNPEDPNDPDPPDPATLLKILQSWEEKPVEIIRPNT